MAIAFVQQNLSTTGGSSTLVSTVALVSATTTGNAIILVGLCGTGVATMQTATDGTNVFTRVHGKSIGGSKPLDIFIAKNITGTAAPTITATYAGGTAIRGGLFAIELSGLATNQPILSFTDAQAAGSNPHSVGCALPWSASPNSVIVMGALQPTNISTTFTAGSGFTNLQQQQDTVTVGVGSSATQIRILSSSGDMEANIRAAINTVIYGISAAFSDVDQPPPKYQTEAQNYQQFKVQNGMSTSEKIR